MRYSSLILFLFSVLVIGCKSHVLPTDCELSEIEKDAFPTREYSVQAVLWQQHSAEYRALAYQAFNLAKIRLDNILDKATDAKIPLAIVTDIDETVLDNSPYSGKQIELNEEYSALRWKEWVEEKKAKAVPGAFGFLHYAKNRGVEIFYISNRSINQKKETIENLQIVGFPYADNKHVLLKDTARDKEARRDEVIKSHEIVLFLGDNLSDFTNIFDNRTTDARNKSVDSLESAFGKKFIVLPNPMYGDWETKGILEGKYHWTTFQKDSIRRKKIKSY